MSATSTSPQPSPRGQSSYPMPAYLNFCPGGVSYASGFPAERAYYYLSDCSSPSIGSPSGDRRGSPQGAFTSRVTSRRQQSRPSTSSCTRAKLEDDASAVSVDSLVYKAKLADDTLRQYAILSGGKGHQTPYFLPSLSLLAEAVFGRLTGVPADNVKAWADAMVIHHLETTAENSADGIKPPAVKAVTESTASVLKRMLEEQENGKDCQVTSSPLSRARPCGYVFKRGDIAWNCRTCQADSTCVICDSCFRNSNHDGHEVYFHRTTPGGCCDCGDPEAWKNEGCCDAHRPAVTSKLESRVDDPEEAVRMAQKSLKESEECLKTGTTALPPKMAAALGVVIGAAVNCLLQAADGAGIGADPIQWKVRWADEASRLQNRACHNEDYCYKTPEASPSLFLNAATPETLPNGYTVHPAIAQ
jgi:Putative zinc finger in N-recognin (UBR box)